MSKKTERIDWGTVMSEKKDNYPEQRHAKVRFLEEKVTGNARTDIVTVELIRGRMDFCVR